MVLDDIGFLSGYSLAKAIATKLVISGFIFLFVISTPFIPNLLVSVLENQYPVLHPNKIDTKNNPVHILILGGGHVNDERLPANDQLSSGALVRLSEGIRLNRMIKGSDIITSGYGGKELITQAEVLSNAAILLGVEPSVIQMQKKPVNTWMEANEYKRIFGDKATLILVTSAVHMPRAMFLFRKIGLNPIAAPTNHILKYGKSYNILNWLPSAKNITKTDAAMHEFVGLLWAAVAYI